MSYASINPDGTIKAIHRKVSPFYRLEPGEWLAGYNPPPFNELTQKVTPIEPVTSPDVQFTIAPI
jgi:hypothetical protein